MQFSLRGLLLAVTVVAIYGGCYVASPILGYHAIVGSATAVGSIWGATLWRERINRQSSGNATDAVSGCLIRCLTVFGYFYAFLSAVLLILAAFRCQPPK